MTLDELNGLRNELAREVLLGCCGSEVWAARMTTNMPFMDATALHELAEAIWFSLGPADWLQAFSKHPKIGAKATDQWSTEEQRGMRGAGEETANMMRELNEQYEQKFGWIFIICATGKSAEQMRRALEERLRNEPKEELQIAAMEQAGIMHLRLDKLLAE